MDAKQKRSIERRASFFRSKPAAVDNESYGINSVSDRTLMKILAESWGRNGIWQLDTVSG